MTWLATVLRNPATGLDCGVALTLCLRHCKIRLTWPKYVSKHVRWARFWGNGTYGGEQPWLLRLLPGGPSWDPVLGTCAARTHR